MKLRSRETNTSSSSKLKEPIDEELSEFSNSSDDEDFNASMIEELDDSEDSSAELVRENGSESDEDIGSSVSRRRKVGIKNKRGNGKTVKKTVDEEVNIGTSNGNNVPKESIRQKKTVDEEVNIGTSNGNVPKESSKQKKTVDEEVNIGTSNGNVPKESIRQKKTVDVEVNIGTSNGNVPKESIRKKKKEDGPTLMWEVWEEEQEMWVAENMAKEIDLENKNEFVSETADPPSDLIMPLLRYQKEWLAWALKQEESVAKGGILADEMGMGKTVQAISLVLAKSELQKAIGTDYILSTLPCSSKELPCVKGTLVICPLVAVIQWVSEIERFTAKGSNRILIYHGANRGKTVQEFSEYDFVITTYSTVEAEYRKNIMPPKQKCQWCGKLLYEHKMAIHLKYFCGPEAVRTAKQSKQRKNKTKFSMRVSKQKQAVGDENECESKGHKGKAGRKKNMKSDKEENNVHVGSSSGNPSGVSIESLLDKSILHSVKWDRIILDEAHYIKDRRCNTTRAILALQSNFKWALSGTPLQNRVGELYSLVRFLQIVPYSYYFCKDCDCRTLDYSSSGVCPNCPHKSVRHFCWWNRYIANPIQNQGSNGAGRGAMFLLKHKLLKSIVLRRTKSGRAADLALPPRIVTLRKDTLDIKEEDYYTSLYNESQSQFNTYIEAGTVMNNYAHIFDLLTRLRQAVDHPYLVVYSKTAAKRSRTVTDDTTGGGCEQICGLCHDPVEDPVVTSCTHIFCKSCLIDFSASMGQVSCPSCSKPLSVDFSTKVDTLSVKPTVKGFRSSSILNRIKLDDFQTSTKIDALREEIRFMVEKDGSAKGIVFSQFTSFLDLIHYSLQKSGINCVQLVGSMSMKGRDAAITRFTDDPDCKIFLMSLKAGGVALNLTVASHVFLMDPWWNPAVERQAQDRIHRIGQYKPIRIVRFVIQNTIEERILKLQEKKELVFEGTVGGSSEALGKLTEADLKFLFVT